MKFGSNKQQNEEPHAGKVTVLSLGFELTGDIISKSDIRADGILVGSIRTDKKVVVGEKASITGDIIAEEISISGEVVGDLYIKGETTIYADAKVSGNIITSSIFIHKGAQINSGIQVVDPKAVEEASKSSKINSVSREELYSMLDDRTSKKKDVPVKPISKAELRSFKESSSTESGDNNDPLDFPRSW
ncbi:protein CcmA, bactofilin family [Cyclobacterium xiamenense]|uniref:Protein CcmA, bactofilin family n=1 Tax=Cyclobacterium xiamenense TaxID=1297121 RepID=A0A1H7AS32_9BACT|nr:polymer-forming cytoskeletal protein [Cyclobacterium xiamenense]SEJ68451.1 protein CcmA, bactofilin family [Cyclobacterium xiamenense]